MINDGEYSGTESAQGQGVLRDRTVLSLKECSGRGSAQGWGVLRDRAVLRNRGTGEQRSLERQ